MYHIVSFSKIKNAIKEKKIIRTKKDLLLCSIVLFLQILTLIFGVFMRGFGSPITIEQRAQIYTTANKSNQTYSMVYHKSDYPLSYLDYHIGTLENSANMKRSGCKIFFANEVTSDLNKTPFKTVINDKTVDSPIVFLANIEYSISDYFGVQMLYGENKIVGDNDVCISKVLADSYLLDFGLSNYEQLVSKLIHNEIDNNDYKIVGVFDSSHSTLNYFFSNELVIGNFVLFSKIAVNPRIGFVTCDKYLENLYFLQRISIYIDPPNYGRTTIVSTKGNDFANGGNAHLTDLIYKTTAIESKSIIVALSWISAILSLVVLCFFKFKLFDNKKCVRVIAVASLFNVLICFGICQIINYHVLASFIPLLGIVNGFTTFIYILIFLLICSALEICFRRKTNKGLGENEVFYYIDI